MSSRRRYFSSLPLLLTAILLLGTVWLAWRVSPTPPPSAPERETTSLPRVAVAANPVAPTKVVTDSGDDVFAAFDAWARAWSVRKSSDTDVAPLDEGIRLATARRAAYWELIASDPEAALAREISPASRSRLPEPVVALLEQAVDGRGDLEWLAAAPRPGGPTPTRAQWRVATIGENRYDAHVTRAAADRPTRLDIPLSGVAVDDRIALRPLATRPLAPGESRPEGEVVTVAMENHIVEPPENRGRILLRRGERVIQPCCATHATLMTSRPEDQWPVAAWGDEGASTGGSGLVGASSWTEGTKRVLAIRVDFSDLPGAPENGSGTAMNATHIANRINNEAHFFFDETSYGKTGLTMTTSDVTGTLRMPRTAQSYALAGDNTGLRLDATALAEGAGFALADYDRVFLVFSDLGPGVFSGSKITYGGLGQIGDKFMWMNGDFSLPLVTHEMGHTYGLGHAGRWQVSGADPVDPAGTVAEYGDEFDRMGSGGSGHPLHPDHFNPHFLNLLDWLPDQAVNEVTAGGTFRLYRFDHKGADLATTRALKINRVADQHYWIGYRRKYAGDPTRGDISEGAYVVWEDPVTPGRSHLIDIDTPGTNAFDASLNVGATFDDSAAGIEIRVDSSGGSGSGEYLDVTVTFDPRISLTATRIDVDEQAGFATLTLNRTGSAVGSVSVNWATADGTATAGADYLPSGGTVTWAHGDLTDKTVSIPIIGDASSEGTESFVVNFTGIGGGVFIGDSTASVYLAEPGSSDSGFSHEWFNYSGSVRDFALQPDGRIAIVGHSVGLGGTTVNGVARLLGDGSSDEDFHSRGEGANAIPIHAIARQADGKLVIGGDFTTLRGVGINRVARLNTDGSLDSTFNPGTGPDGSVRDIAIQPDGRVVIVGHFTSVGGIARRGIARLHRDGSLDTGFYATAPAGTGGTTIEPEAVALQPDGKVLVGGFLYANWMTIFDGFSSGLWRLHPDGSIDTGFDVGYGAHSATMTNQLQTVDAIVVQPDGKVLAGGRFTGFNNSPSPRLVRLHPDGSVDTAFRAALGTGPDDSLSALLLQNDGRIVIGGTFKNFNGQPILYAARLQAGGALDPFFDADLIEVVPESSPPFDNSVHALALQPDGKILIGQNSYGDGQRAIARVFSALPGLAGTVEFTGGTHTGEEGGNAILTARRTGGSHGAVSISYATIPETASEGVDYPPTTGVLTWADGESGDRTLTVPLTSDAVIEPVETFRVQLGIPIGGVQLGAQAIAQVSVSDPPTTSINPPTKSIDHQGQTYPINITSTGAWTAAESLPWLAISPTSGAGNATLTVTVDANAVSNPRLGTIDISGITHTLTQAGTPTLDIDPETREISAAATVYTIAITSNTDWVVTESLPWLSVSPSSGNGDAILSVTVEANPDLASRSGDIAIGTATHQLTQLGVPAFLDISPPSRTVNRSAQSYPIEISSNAPWAVTEALDWVTVSPASGAGDGTVTVTLTENVAPDARQGTLQIGGENHLITQAGTAEAVTLTPDNEATTPATTPIPWSDSLAGIYDGLLRDSSDGHTLVGAVSRLAVTPPLPGSGLGGNASATLFFNGRRAVIRGAFALDGSLRRTLAQPDGTVIEIDLQLAGTGNPHEERLVGTIEWDGLTAGADLPRAPFHPRLLPVPTPEEDPLDGVATTHTLLLPRESGWTDSEPGGHGWATVTINRGGLVRVVGALGDGTRFTEVAHLSRAGSFDLHTELYRPVTGLGRGRFGGRLILRDLPDISDGDGRVQWLKHPDPRELRHPDGFALESWALLSRYVLPPVGSPSLDQLSPEEYNTALGIEGVSLPDGGAPIDKVITWRPNNTLIHYGPERILGRVQRTSGALTLAYFDPLTRARLAITGVAYQKQGFAAGNFLLGAASGAARLQLGTGLAYPGSEDPGVAGRPALPGAPAAAPAISPVGAFEASALGVYGGVIVDEISGEPTGGLSGFLLNRNGGFSGQLWIGRVRYPVRGSFDPATGIALTPVPLGGGNGVALLTLTLERVDAAAPETGYRVTGSVEIGGVDHAISAERRPPTTTWGGAHTLALRAPDGTDPDLAPAGDGHGVLTVATNAVCRGLLVLADGQRTALTGHLSSADEWSLYRPLYAGARGFLSGRMTFRDQPGIGQIDGELRWVRQSDAPPANVYPGGFDTRRGVVGGAYLPPAAGSRALTGLDDAYHNAWLRLAGPDFSGDLALGITEIDRAITWSAANRLTHYGPERIILNFNPRNGMLTGRLLHPASGINASLGGVLLQEQGLLTGAAIVGGRSGPLTVEPR